MCTTFRGGTRLEPPARAGVLNILRFAVMDGMAGSRISDAVRRLRSEGATSSSSIHSNHLQICETLQASALERALHLVRARLEPLVMSPRSFERARNSALNALAERQRTPLGAGLDRAHQLAFQELGSISHPPLGTRSGHAKAELSDVRALHRQISGPGQVLVTIAGNVDEHAALQAARRILGSSLQHTEGGMHAAASAAPELRLRQRSERFSTQRLEQLERPQVIYAWPLPSSRERAAAASLVAAVNQDPPHPAFRKLLTEDGPLQHLHASLLSDSPPFLLAIDFEVRSGPAGDIDKAQKLLKEALARLGEAEESNGAVSAPASSHPDNALFLATALSRQELSSAAKTASETSVDHLVRSLSPQRRTTVELYPTRWRMDPPPRIVHRTHEVRKGDTLLGIAAQYGASVKDIAKANGLRRENFILPGQELIVPIHNKAAKHRQTTYEVQRGDSLSRIAARHQVSTAALRAANGLAKSALIRTGQSLKIPPSKKPKRRTIVVKRGDSWIRLARRYHTTPRLLANENGRSTKSKLFVGETLYLPHGKKR